VVFPLKGELHLRSPVFFPAHPRVGASGYPPAAVQGSGSFPPPPPRPTFCTGSDHWRHERLLDPMLCTPIASMNSVTLPFSGVSPVAFSPPQIRIAPALSGSFNFGAYTELRVFACFSWSLNPWPLQAHIKRAGSSEHTCDAEPRKVLTPPPRTRISRKIGYF